MFLFLSISCSRQVEGPELSFKDKGFTYQVEYGYHEFESLSNFTIKVPVVLILKKIKSDGQIVNSKKVLELDGNSFIKQVEVSYDKKKLFVVSHYNDDVFDDEGTFDEFYEIPVE